MLKTLIFSAISLQDCSSDFNSYSRLGNYI